MNPPIVFKNARMVLPDEVQTGSLSVEAGRIAGFGASNSSLPQAIDLEGDYLMPGFIEVHTDNFERHLMPRPKVQWAEMPALMAHDAEIAAAGITTVFDAMGVGDADHESLRGTAWDAVLQTLDACTAENVLRADHHLHVRCELPAHNTIALFQPFHGHQRLSLISLMDHTPGQRQWENLEHARIYYTGKKGWSQDKFEQGLYAEGYGKQALLIDVRDNGGGSTADYLLTMLHQPRHAYTIGRNGKPGYPIDRLPFYPWLKPAAWADCSCASGDAAGSVRNTVADTVCPAAHWSSRA